jgi:hypothetical protein
MLLTRIGGLGSLLKILSPLIRHAARALLEKNASRMTPAERAAIEALLTAAQVLESLLPIPGVDNDPRTLA